MSGRLASFRGPSTPNASTNSKQNHPTTPPASPSRISESTFHRKIRASLLEIRAICRTWDDLVLIDGLKAAKHLIDTRTDLEYVAQSCVLVMLSIKFIQQYSLIFTSRRISALSYRRPKTTYYGERYWRSGCRHLKASTLFLLGE
jgi:hypothetical protein